MNAQPQMLQRQIEVLLLRWEELREQGRTLSAAELAADSPELIPELAECISALRAVDAMLAVEPLASDANLTGLGGPQADGPPQPSLGASLAATVWMAQARFHARGGLGEVLVALQDDLGRRVAVKRIRQDKRRPVAHRRFLREAAITAGLQHPGIVPIYALGQDEDGPFYVMPFVEGQTLDAAIRRYREDASASGDPGRRALEFRALLQRLVTVCETMAYAHDRNVVHRDLKPSNIMLGPYGETLVMDWGLAKRCSTRAGTPDAESELEVETEDPLRGSDSVSEALTATGAVVGTPQYMSPEQSYGRPVGPASDIFSLGAILQSILAGEAPSETLGATGQGRWWPLGRYRLGRSAALRAICSRAMADEPESRYQSAGALAGDLTKWLAGEPVSAYRERLDARLRRWLRRHPRLVTGVAVAALTAGAALVALTAVVSASNRQLGRTNDALGRALSEAELERDRAEEVTAFLVSALRTPDPTKDGRTVAVAEVLGRTYRELENRPEMAPATRVSVLDAVGQSYLGLGLVQESEKIAKQAAVLAVEQLGANHPETLRANHNLALAYLEATRFELAIPLFERTLAAQTNLLGAHHPNRLLTMSALGRAYVESGQANRALPLLEQALAGQRSRFGTEHADVITTMNNLARAYRAQRQPERAIALYELALTAARATLGENDYISLGTMNNLAAAYTIAGQSDRAIPLQEQLLAAVRAKLGDEHPNTLTVTNNLARALSRVKQFDRSIPLSQGLLKIQRTKLGERHLHTLTTMSNLAQDYINAGRLDDAIAQNEEALRAQRTHLGSGHQLTIHTMSELASAYQSAGRLDRAIALSEEALQDARTKFGPHHIDTLRIQRNLAGCYDRARRFGDAKDLLRITVDACAKIPSRPDAFCKDALHSLGACLLHEQKYAEAEAILRDSLAIAPGPQASDAETAEIRGLLGEALVQRQAFDEAEPLLLASEKVLAEHPERVPPLAREESKRAAINRLIRLYEAWGKQAETANWKQVLLVTKPSQPPGSGAASHKPNAK